MLCEEGLAVGPGRGHHRLLDVPSPGGDVVNLLQLLLGRVPRPRSYTILLHCREVGVGPTVADDADGAVGGHWLLLLLLIVRRTATARGAAEGFVVAPVAVDVDVAGHVPAAVQARRGRPRLVRVLRQLAADAGGFPEHVRRIHAGRADGVATLVVEAAVVLRGRGEGQHGRAQDVVVVGVAAAVLGGGGRDGGLGHDVVGVGVVRAPPRGGGGVMDVYNAVPFV